MRPVKTIGILRDRVGVAILWNSNLPSVTPLFQIQHDSCHQKHYALSILSLWTNPLEEYCRRPNLKSRARRT